jgi:Tfp pilus assembly protein PilP
MSLRLVPFLIAVATVASAQTPATPAAPTPVTAAATPTEESATEPRGFTYDAKGRRDPFVSLLRRGSDGDRAAAAVRAPGLAGLGASEVTLKGTLASKGGFVAIMQGVDAKTYIVRPGEKLSDGTVRTITPDAVVILQQVKDPLSTEGQREVRKTLRQTEEAK